MGNVRRTKLVTLNRTIEDVTLAFLRAQAWNKAQDMAVYPLALSRPKKGYEVLMTPDTSGFVAVVS